MQSEETENTIIENFVKNNKYPSYSDIEKKLPINLKCEYGEPNHYYCKTIFENPTNLKIIRKMGRKIYERGGFQALQANYYTLMCYSPFGIEARLQPKMDAMVLSCWASSYIEYAWSGIGEWKF